MRAAAKMLILFLPALAAASVGISLAGGATAGMSGAEYVDVTDPALAIYRDPGAGEWEIVAPADLIEVCGLDPDILEAVDATATYPYAIVRYGKLCHEFYPAPVSPPPSPAQLGEIRENYSATKTLGAAVVGRAAKMSADLLQPLSDEDRVDAWIGDITFNEDALVADVLAMVGHNASLEFGERQYSYDTVGTVQINRLSDVVEAVIAQSPAHFGGVATTGEFAQRYLFTPLGMQQSTWTGEIFAYSWQSSLRDMARLGLLLTHEGVWDQKRLIDADWVYKMTHPVYEDANTAYGYLTWVAANSAYYVPGLEVEFNTPIGSCQPPAVWPEYPHGLSEATDCGYIAAHPCEQTLDVGVFAAVGFEGQLIVGHRALDLVVVTKDAGLFAFITTPWDLIKDALIAHDPVYAGDTTAFCAAYSTGSYAPDLIVPEPAAPLAAASALVALRLLRKRRRATQQTH